jgi:para-nitrobenzyl esterase
MPPLPRRIVRSPLLIAAVLAVAAPLFVIGTANAITTSGFSDNPIIRTDQGLVRGMRVGDVRQFRGIPYAGPASGEHRWQPPQPAPTWSGVRDATQFGDHCAQNPSAFGIASTSEDCLFLNVFTPRFAIPEVGISPVMVWIHGGALVTGASDSYDPSDLVARGVTVVTVNYRLGALGFLAHPAIAAESPQGAAGNYGLLDQQAALRWVERNIRHFGGNPRSVTIFGESAGGLSVHTQLASPLAAGLFDKAIVESGAYQLTQAPLQTAGLTANAFAAAAGCPDQTAACLRALPLATILARQTSAIAAPTVDGYVLTKSVGQAFADGTFNHVPIIEGSNHDEWRLFVAQTEATTHVPLDPDGYVPAIQRTLLLTDPAAAAAIAAEYPLASYSSPSVALSAIGTDRIFACNARRATASLSQFVAVYQYEFNDPDAPMVFFPPVSFPTGAYHAAEIQYLFDSFTTPSPALTDAQEQLSRTMIRYWTNFAWFGNPNFFGTPVWPRFTTTELEHQALVPGQSSTATDFAADHKCAA